MWKSPLPKGILGDPHLAHMIASSVPSSRDLRRSESVIPEKLNTRSVTIHRNSQEIDESWQQCVENELVRRPFTRPGCQHLGWCLIHPRSCQLQRCSGSQALHFHPCFVRFRYLWWFSTWSWQHGLRRRYDHAQQTTTIRRLTKFQCDLNTRKGRSLLVALEKAWRCLQILLKPSESMNCSLQLLSMNLLQQNRQW